MQPLFAEIGTATNSQVGLWIVIAIGMVNFFASVATVLGLFASKREVDKIDARVSKLEDTGTETVREIAAVGDKIKEKMNDQEKATMHSADRRSTVLHERINVLSTNTAEMKGSMEAFTQSFDNFTKILTAQAEQKKP